MRKYRVELYLDAPDAYDVGRVAAAVGLALAERPAQDLTLTRLETEEWSD